MTPAQWRILFFGGVLAFVIALPLTAQQPMDEQEVNAAGGPKLVMPGDIKSAPGIPFVVKLDTDCKWIRWRIPSGLTRVPPKDTAYGDRAFVGYGPVGVYEFLVEATKNDVYAETRCIVYVGQPGPPPPPGPSPPPAPVPPSDPVFAAMQAAYTADSNPKKAEFKVRLIDVYATAADMALTDDTLTGTTMFFAKMRTVSQALLKDNLHGLRDATKACCKEFETGDIPFTPELRAKLAACLQRAAGLLGSVK